VSGAGRREADVGATLLCYGDFAGARTNGGRRTTDITKSKISHLAVFGIFGVVVSRIGFAIQPLFDHFGPQSSIGIFFSSPLDQGGNTVILSHKHLSIIENFVCWKDKRTHEQTDKQTKNGYDKINSTCCKM
jgi:hypothetical protein